MGEKSWKQVLDEKLYRLHSLFFGVEAAIEKEEWEKGLGLGLRLLGFLDSECRTEEDRLCVDSIRISVQDSIDIAKNKIYRSIEPKCPVFEGHGSIDLEKIRTSAFYKPFVKLVQEKDKNSVSARVPVSTDIEQTKTKKVLSQTKVTSLFTNGNRKTGDDTSEFRRSRFPLLGSGVQRTQRRDELIEDSHSGGRKRGRDSLEIPSDGVNHDETREEIHKSAGFVTAKQKLAVDAVKKNGFQYQYSGNSGGASPAAVASNNCNKTLGVPRRCVRSNFVPPIRANGNGGTAVGAVCRNTSSGDMDESTRKCLEMLAGPDGELPDQLRNLEPRLLEHISNEIMEKDSNVRWDDIAGLDHAKKSVTEMVIWPLLRPDIFHGCRSPGKGLLLFGPPGTGKTMIGKAIAGEAKATFFSISASSLTSKWIGEGEKLVRALFGVASCRQPAVIFVDEVDSLLSQRKADGEHESSRRLKTQFLIEMEGIGSGNEQLLLIGATNRPQELDEAARRRFSKRLYISLPSTDARAWIIRSLLHKDGLLSLSNEDVDAICLKTEGYSGSDMNNLVKEASLWPLREALLQGKDISMISTAEMRPISLQDFMNALQQVRPSVSKEELGTYEDWNHQFGSLCL